ncbi:uncharacterized protein LOC118265721 isoform X3 [Spodoptera frugiperda]|uniref:Uncharacterized protein LOC118265721 isoform X3 n=1 Tax=Spodoptera frugiperda TaxID=7108 RepID=A0A9R0EWH4_SPOFR|nr:uncharacterized protein LOC118265721 isoform X3 [Spodoptera frugiperda]
MAHIEESLQNYLNKIAREQKYVNPEITIEEISSGGANYTSKLYTAVVREAGKEDLHLFAKVAVLGESMREVLPNMYTTEQYMYTTLAKWYERMEQESGVKEEDRLLFCKFYGFDPSLYREILVLENLLPQGYGPHDRFHSIDWPYAAAAVRELAKMHALSFAFAKKHPEEFEKAMKNISLDWPEEIMETMIRQAVPSAVKVVSPEHKEAFVKFMDESLKTTYFDILKPVNSKLAIIHRDYRGNNLLHRRREDGTVDIKIVDLQTLQGGSPVTDLIYFIFTGSDEKFRAQYFDKLLDHYYTELSAAMKRLQLNPDEVFSRADFDYEMKEKLPFGLTLAVFTLPVVTVEMENAPQVDESLDISKFNVEKTSDLYAERLNGVVNDYVKWGILK